MSSDVFVLKARWRSVEAAAEARPKVEALFKDMERAYDAWQTARTISASLGLPEEGRKHQRVKFLLDHRSPRWVLGLMHMDVEELTGQLESPYLDESADIRWRRAGLRVQAELWSGTDWSRLCESLKRHFGAEVASWREARLV